MPKLPKEIILTIDGERNPKGLTVDGEEFPWHLTADASVSQGSGMPTVTVTIPAECIAIEGPNFRAVFPGGHGGENQNLIVNLPELEIGTQP